MSARYVQPLRIVIQYLFLIFILWLGWRFSRFVLQFSDGIIANSRPDGIEGFLPISGLLGTVAWLKGLGINPVHPAATVIFLTAVALSLLLRRSFCSWICPVATVSEILWKTGFRIFKRSIRLPRWLDIGLRGIKYMLLAFFIYSIVFVMSAAAIQAFIYSDYHRIADIRLLYFFLNISPTALAIIITLIALSVIIKNPACRYLCPYGALLGVIALLSPVRVTRNLERCVSCGMCSQVCPSRIDVMHKKNVTSPECIGCWRCVSFCRFNEALSMRFAGQYIIPGVVFAILVAGIFWGGTLVGKATGYWQTNITLQEYRQLLGR